MFSHLNSQQLSGLAVEMRGLEHPVLLGTLCVVVLLVRNLRKAEMLDIGHAFGENDVDSTLVTSACIKLTRDKVTALVQTQPKCTQRCFSGTVCKEGQVATK